MPRCHRYVEEGCRILKSSKHENFMVISPDGLICCVEHCDGKCENGLNLPIGLMAVEMKCPYIPIHNKEMLPVQYMCPYYYVCQVMSEMKVLSAPISIILSCSPKSLTMCYMDFSDDLWDKMWNLALEFYDTDKPQIQQHLHKSISDLKEQLKAFAIEKSIIVVEVLTLQCIDTKTYENMENENNPMYRFQPRYPTFDMDEEQIQQEIIECCTSSMQCIREAHDLCR